MPIDSHLPQAGPFSLVPTFNWAAILFLKINAILISRFEMAGTGLSRGLQKDVVYLGWPIAPSYMRPNAGGGGSCGVSANEYSCTLYTGAQINFGDLSPYLTYGVEDWEKSGLGNTLLHRSIHQFITPNSSYIPPSMCDGRGGAAGLHPANLSQAVVLVCNPVINLALAPIPMESRVEIKMGGGGVIQIHPSKHPQSTHMSMVNIVLVRVNIQHVH